MSEPQRKPRTKEETAELTAKLVHDYTVIGSSLKQLENRYDVAASYVSRLLRRAGVELREPANATPHRRAGWGSFSREEIREYRDRLAAKKP